MTILVFGVGAIGSLMQDWADAHPQYRDKTWDFNKVMQERKSERWALNV